MVACALSFARPKTTAYCNRRDDSAPFCCPTSTNYIRNHANAFRLVRAGQSGVSSGLESNRFDIVIAGAGIIGLTIARQFLLGSSLSVAVVDAATPCFGATGAGQGYIWRVHKAPTNEKWELAIRSHQLWEALAESIEGQGMDPALTIGWKKTGSLLVGRTSEESFVLMRKVQQLVDAGLNAKFLSQGDLLSEEPALKLGEEGGAAFMPDDCQIDAQRAVAFIEKANRKFAAEGRYAEFYHDPVINLLRSESTGEIDAVQTSKNLLRCEKAVVIATGSWSGSLVHDLLKNFEIELDFPVKPRKGHLLVLGNFNSFKLNHGLMEVGYVGHESAVLTPDTATGFEDNLTSVSMTATMDASGRIVLGSSRQLVGFSTQIEESILHRIWERAGVFFPVLREVSLSDLIKTREVRVGLRPYCSGTQCIKGRNAYWVATETASLFNYKVPAGKPVIAPVPGLPKMFISAGHEGEGLSMALGTAEMIFNMVLDNPHRVDPSPFSL